MNKKEKEEKETNFNLGKKYTKVMCLCVCVCACACVYWGNWKFSLGRNISMHDYELFLELPYKM